MSDDDILGNVSEQNMATARAIVDQITQRRTGRRPARRERKRTRHGRGLAAQVLDDLTEQGVIDPDDAA